MKRLPGKAAEYKLLVDFHGSYKPSGLRRTYPNVMTREGVKGLEHSKWSKDITPDHNLTIPFIRMVAGPMDYTPGAMINLEKEILILCIPGLQAREHEFTRWLFILHMKARCR